MKEPRLIPLKSMTSDIVKVSWESVSLNLLLIKKKSVMLFVSNAQFVYRHSCSYLSFTDAALCGGKSPENVGGNKTVAAPWANL